MIWPTIFWLLSAPSPEYILTTRALDACPWGEKADPFAVQELLHLEEQAGLPVAVQGILPATWCVEASMRTPERLRGDHGEAWGPFQMHGWLRNLCRGMDADNLFEAARCYLERVVNMEPKARTKCPNTSWIVAENVTANWPRYGWSCVAMSDHWNWRMQMQKFVDPKDDKDRE